MKDDWNDAYKASLATSKWRFETQGLKASDRSYEYGLLVVKNAMLVSGGGLFFIPTIVGLSSELDIEWSWAFSSGMLFGACVLMTLIASYMIHVNWLLNGAAWEDIYEIEKIGIRKAFGTAFEHDESELVRLKSQKAKRDIWINRFFYSPHLIAFLFVLLFGAAAWCLYEAFSETIGNS
jgi:hypothetical protein